MDLVRVCVAGLGDHAEDVVAVKVARPFEVACDHDRRAPEGDAGLEVIPRHGVANGGGQACLDALELDSRDICQVSAQDLARHPGQAQGRGCVARLGACALARLGIASTLAGAADRGAQYALGRVSLWHPTRAHARADQP